MELGGTLFPTYPLFGVGRTPLALLRLLRVPFGGRRVFGRGISLPRRFLLLLRCLHAVGLGFLAMSSRLIAKAFTPTFSLTAPVLGGTPECQQPEGDHDNGRSDDGDYGNRRHGSRRRA
jgi:hypothetical protein